MMWLDAFASFTSLRCLRLHSIQYLPDYYAILTHLPPGLQHLQLEQSDSDEELQLEGDWLFEPALRDVLKNGSVPKTLRQIRLKVWPRWGKGSGGELAMYRLDKEDVSFFKSKGIEILIDGAEDWDPLELLAELKLE